MAPILRRGAATLVAVLTGLALMPSTPAAADSGGFGDEDSRGRPDVRKVFVQNTQTHRVRISVRYDGGMAEYTRVYVDTDPRDAGPEYLVEQDIDAAGAQRRFGVAGLERWGQEPRAAAYTCPSLPTRIRRDAGDVVVGYLVPRSCLGDPGAVRVGVYVFDYIGTRDWAPAPRTFGPPVAEG